MSWIDGGEWDSVRGQELRDLLADSYPSTPQLRRLSQDAQIPGRSLPSEALAPLLQWNELLQSAHGIGKLRRLLEVIVADRAALRDRLDKLSSDDPGQNVGNPQDAYDVRLL